jgi:hypothetical protein
MRYNFLVGFLLAISPVGPSATHAAEADRQHAAEREMADAARVQFLIEYLNAIEYLTEKQQQRFRDRPTLCFEDRPEVREYERRMAALDPEEGHLLPQVQAIALAQFRDIILPDLVRIILTNIAMTKHDNETANAAPWHAAAACAGIISNLIHANILYSNHNAAGQLFASTRQPQNGDIFALSSSLTEHVIDLIVHIKNARQAKPYQEISTANSVGIRSAQALEVLASCLSNYYRPNTDFQTAMHNTHATLVAIEKMLLTESYASAEVKNEILLPILASSGLINTGNACYYGAK